MTLTMPRSLFAPISGRFPWATFAVACLALAGWAPLAAQDRPGTNSNESKVRPYTLPDPLTAVDGSKVTDARGWTDKRRGELLELFRSQMYGRSPARPAGMTFELTSTEPKALGGLATRQEIDIRLSADADSPKIRILLYVPNGARRPAPVALGVNFDGNHTIDADPGITIVPHWSWDAKEKRASLTTADEKTRGASVSRWSVETIVKRGYALATISRASVEPDYAEGWQHGVRGWYLRKSGREQFAADDWGAIAAWGWGVSRVIDYLETRPDLDARRTVLTGHSRLGKAALWAGAEDPRIAVVVSNNSGEGGAAIARRWFGETTAVINRSFPHWFCGNFKQYADDEAKLPFDQHELVALAAPRPVYVASADGDLWADPRGEFLAALHAEPVYRLFGKKGLGQTEMPPVNTSIGDAIGYHLRAGKHDITEFDWQKYLDFADRHFGSSGK